MRSRSPSRSPSASRSRVVRALVSRPARFILWLVLLMLPWPGLGHVYARFIAGLANATVGGANPPVTLRFTVPDGATAAVSPFRLDVFAEDAVSGQFVQTALDLRRGGYIATAVFVALTLATPMRWRRKLGALAIGVLSLQLLPILPVLSFFSGKLQVQVFHFGVVGRSLIEIAYHALVAPPGMAYAAPALLWLFLVWLIEPSCLRSFAVAARNRFA